jgi:hypothetical protein
LLISVTPQCPVDSAGLNQPAGLNGVPDSSIAGTPLMTSNKSTPNEIFEAIKSKDDGPIKKFELIKAFGAPLRQSGFLDPETMCCAELERLIGAIIHTLK